MKRLEDEAQEIVWLGNELKREVKTLATTQYPHIHTFLAKNILHAIEKEVTGMRQQLTTGQEENAS